MARNFKKDQQENKPCMLKMKLSIRQLDSNQPEKSFIMICDWPLPIDKMPRRQCFCFLCDQSLRRLNSNRMNGKYIFKNAYILFKSYFKSLI